MFSINQTVFTFHDNCCRLVSAIHLAFNNILKKSIDTDDINKFILKEYNKPISQTGGHIKGGVNIMIDYLKKRYNITPTYRVIKMFGIHFNRGLDRGMLIALPIIITESYTNNWKSGKKIQGDYTNSKVTGGHWFCVFRKDGKDYLLNSGDPKHNIREIDLKTKGLFKLDKAYILS